MNIDASPIWDVHHHWVNEEGYIDRLLREMDRLGIEKTGLIAMGDFVPDLFVMHRRSPRCAGNADLARLVRERPERFWGWGYIRLGWHQDDDVDRLAESGMAGLKFHMPRAPYGEERYFPVYEKAHRHRLPCLFHTGVFYPPSPMPGRGIRSGNCRPIHLEPIAHEFPDLNIICAHLGVCWNDEAATLCRMFPNFYADLSGRVDGWRSSRPIDWFKQILYWPTAHKKVLFGSDVHSDEIHQTLEDHRRIFAGIGWDQQQMADAFHKNAKRLFGA